MTIINSKKTIWKHLTIWSVIFLFGLGVYGAVQKRVEVLSNKCVGCKDCLRICPKNAVIISKGKAIIDTENCNGCGLCVYMCSYNAIRYRELK